MIMPSVCYTLLITGDWLGALACSLSNVLPLGLFWVLMGMIIFAAMQVKSKNFAVSGVILILYLAIIIPANLVEVSIQPFLALLIGLLIAALIIKLIK